MSEIELFAKARAHEGTDPSDDIPAVVALTPLEVAAFSRYVRLETIKEVAAMLQSESDEAKEFGYERFSRYTAEAVQKVLSMAEKSGQ